MEKINILEQELRDYKDRLYMEINDLESNMLHDAHNESKVSKFDIRDYSNMCHEYRLILDLLDIWNAI